MLKKQNFLLLVITMLSVVKTFADEPIDNSTGDGPAAPLQTPITGYIIPLMVVAVLLGAYFFYVSNKKNLTVK